MKHTKRTIGLVALALTCCFLIASAQPVNAILPVIIFGIALLAGFVTAFLVNAFQPPPPGVTADSHLSLFYNAKNNEFMSLTVGLQDEASSLNGTGYYLGRKAEYAAMNYLNNTLYPTFPKWSIFSFSNTGMIMGITEELGLTFSAWISNYNSVVSDAVNYAQLSFTGPLAALDLKADSTSLKTGANDLSVVYGTGHHQLGAHDFTNITIGNLIVTNSSNNLLVLYTTYVTDFNYVYVIDQITGNETALAFQSYTYIPYHLSNGVYSVLMHNQGYDSQDDIWGKIWTNALFVDAPSQIWSANSWVGLYSESRNVAPYTTLNFIDTQPVTYTITMTNTTQCDILAMRYSLDLTQNFAASLANAYWTTLRNAQIYDISQIPSNMVIPLPDFAFISNEDLLTLNAYEIMAMYQAYLKALGNFFNSTTYELITNSSFTYANITFANLGVIVDGFLYRNETLITNGSLYIQVYADMDLVIGNNTLNSSGLLYNLNDTTCWSYAAGDILNATSIWVRDPATGAYTSVTNASIKAQTIEAYLYYSESGPPAVPTGSAGGGGSSGLLLILIAIVIMLVLSRGSGSSGNQGTTINVKKQSDAKPKIPLFFNLEKMRS